MAYRLEQSESPAAGLKRIAREQLDAGLQELEAIGPGDASGHVHEARKSLKKSRAVVRLVRKEVGGDLFRAENVRMREAGRMLAPARDGDVLLETLDGLSGGKPAGLVEVLREERDREHQRLVSDAEILEQASAAFAESRARVDAWPIERTDSAMFAKSLKKTYGRGRKAFAAAYESPAPKRFHELRKRVKYLWYYTRILRPCGGAELKAYRDWADEAAELLGIDHDFAVLSDRIGELGRRAGRKAERKELLIAIGQERLTLERRALPLLRRLFAEKPKSFTSRIAARFDTWRSEQASMPRLWLTEPAAEAARAALHRKETAADESEQRQIRSRLRRWGLEPAGLAPLTPDARELTSADLGELIDRGVVGVGDADRLSGGDEVDELREVSVKIAPNEASGLCSVASQAVLDRCGWDSGFWVILDDTSVGSGTVAVGRSRRNGAVRWEAKPVETSLGAESVTDDGEDCVRVGDWIYVFGSHYGSKEGPLEPERQFVARFREARALDVEPVEMQLAGRGFALHRLLNDALAASDVDIWELSEEAHSALVSGTIREGEEGDDDRAERVERDDHPINIEGVAVRPGGGVLIGLRYPVSAEGHPLIVEVDGIERLFDGGLPEVRGVWILEGVGSRFVPAGIRALGEGPDGSIEAITGNLDSVGKGSILIDAHPEAALAGSAHFRLSFPGNRKSGPVKWSMVRELPGLHRVEGVAADRLGRTFYVSDVDERVELRYAES